MKAPRRILEARADFRRRVLRESKNAVLGDVQRAESEVGLPDGSVVPVREYRRTPVVDGTREPGGTLVFFHSGAFVTGDLDTGDPVAAALCDATGMNVISVDYPLAPENPYPSAVNAGLAVTRALADRLPAGQRLVVAGDSAGGGLAASVVHAMVASSIRVDAQLLFYPCLDLRGSFPQQRVSPDVYSIPEMLRTSYEFYLGGADPVVSGASPGLVGDLRSLPPTIIAVGSHDPLRHEAAAFAERLTESDVSATLLSFNLMHGFVEHYALEPACRVAVTAAARILESELQKSHVDVLESVTPAGREN